MSIYAQLNSVFKKGKEKNYVSWASVHTTIELSAEEKQHMALQTFPCCSSWDGNVVQLKKNKVSEDGFSPSASTSL